MILSLKPDMVLLLKEHATLVEFLRKNQIAFLTIDNEKVIGILRSFKTIGLLCDKKQRADSLIAAVQSQMRDTIHFEKPPRVLLCVGRNDAGSKSIRGAYVASDRTFYGELIRAAGGVNAYPDSSADYPAVSAEGIVRLAPDIVIDIMLPPSNISVQDMERDWLSLPMLPAARNQMMFCLTQDFMTIPGPRIVLILAEFKKIMVAYKQQTSSVAKKG
jgi:iron complex transport system substrate-binding protein